MNKTMIIEGMMCAHCTGRVQKALEAVEGVESVVMSLEEKSAVLTLSSQVEDEALKAAVAEAGYEVTQIREPGGSGTFFKAPFSRRLPSWDTFPGSKSRKYTLFCGTPLFWQALWRRRCFFLQS